MNKKIIQKLIEHDKKFDRIYKEFNDIKRMIMEGQKEILTILKRLDKRHIFTKVKK